MPATRCQFAPAAFAPVVLGTLTCIASVAPGAAARAAVDLAPESNRCAEPATPLELGSAQWNGWGRDLNNTRYQPEPAIRASDVPKLALKWAFGFQGSVVAGQPTVVDGRLFVASAIGRVYSLDAKSGCTFWTYDAPSGIRTAMSVGELGVVRKIVESKRAKHKLAHVEVVKAPSAVIFGDDSGAVSALDAQKGTLLWRTLVSAAPGAPIIAAPAIYRDRVYVAVSSRSAGGVGARGGTAAAGNDTSVAALELATGRIVWSSALGAGVSVPPTIDAKHTCLYVATSAVKAAESGEIAALDLNDGKLRWSKKLPAAEPVGPAAGMVAGAASAASAAGGAAGAAGAAAAGSAPGAADFTAAVILRSSPGGRQLLVAGQKSGFVYGLDPDRAGELVWQSGAAGMAGPGGGGVEYGLAADYRSVFVALSGLAADPMSPVGSMTALDLKTGVRRWHTAVPSQACSWGAQSCWHAQSQAITVLPGIVMSGSMDGHLRAYSTIDGKIVWDFDTAKDFVTLNGIKASGGSLDEGGPTIVNGIVYLNSGYALRPGQPGNVLLAFSVDGK